jgi:type I restriction enzyme S subunit
MPPSSWRQTTLSEIGDIVTGKTPPAVRAEYFSGHIPFVTPSDFDGRRKIDATARSLTDSGAASVGRALVPPNAVMVSCIGSDMGKAAMSTFKCITNQQINSLIIGPDADPQFVYYNLSRRKEEIQRVASGSAQPILNKSAFGRIPILLPPLPQQHAIASILGALDDKIELNRKISATLEALARAVFESWFVDFDPVRAKAEGRDPGLPAEIAAMFPNLFEETGHGEVPVGWNSVSLIDMVEINPATSLAGVSEAPYLDMSNVPTRGHAANTVITRTVSSGSRFKLGDTLLARITPCLENGKTAFVDFLPEDVVGWGSTEFIVMRPRQPMPMEYGYLLARSDAFRAYAIGKMTGTSGRQRIPADSLSAYPVVQPPAAVCTAFSSVIQPMFRRMSAAFLESRTLAAVRDALLPKLISGELRVADAERTLEMST